MAAWFDALWSGDLRALVIVAHPDDETIGAGALLPKLKDVTVAFATDGAPVRPGKGVNDPDRLAYKAARRAESDAALDLAGVRPDRRVHLDYIDQQTPWSLPALVEDVRRLLDEARPDVVLTHPYEGGHPDHDAVAIAVAAAVERRRVPTVHAEMAFYHRSGEALRTGAFLQGGPPVLERVLTCDEQRAKQRLLDVYQTQRATVARFGIAVERYRLAPRVDPVRAPHEGRLHYEVKGWFDSATFRRLAQEVWELVC